MMQGEKGKAATMEDKLHQRVVGQDEAIAARANAIRRSRLGLSDPNRPHGQLLVPGLHRGQDRAVQGAKGFLFDSEEHLLRVTCPNFYGKT